MPLTGANSGSVKTEAVETERTMAREIHGRTIILDAGLTFFACVRCRDARIYERFVYLVLAKR